MRALLILMLVGCSAVLDLDGYSYDGDGADAGTDGGIDAATDGGTDAEVDATSDAPLDADVGATAIAIAAGDSHTCAVRSDGAIFCWGENDSLQSGSSDLTDRLVPSRVTIARSAVEVGAGETHSCARFDDGSIACWGSGGTDTDYRLGSDLAMSASPVGVLGLPDDAEATQLAVGHWYSCAVAGGDAYCWGQNASGELGICCDEQPMAVRVPGVTTEQVAAGNGAACAIVGPGVGTLFCWGYVNGEAPLGTRYMGGGTAAPPLPVQSGGTDLVGISTVEAGGTTTFGFGGHICAITTDDRILCWGRNDSGQVGNGDTGPVEEPFEVETDAPVDAISLGGGHTCAVLQTDEVLCWGDNRSGQLGVAGDGALVPQTIPGLNAREVAAGGLHTCVIDSSGSVWCWGDNASGQLGDGSRASSSMPVRVDIPAD